ncbi:EscI/YscI/HrpB family type III secretion system inner rod protein [Photobacterium leiognathi]|uniref:EscI/YscI/HrpB family type III secretion system inner rod protein n=1 Tax=Photobacterium leiognathi TaxID=553611 RepID=UPI002980B766|nr:EscI/YscI/HrpB family type III secretion system inner rod protein [Photobacterium leiognathi]
MPMFPIDNIHSSSSIVKETFNHVGEGFERIIDSLDRINEGDGNITIQDTLSLQKEVFEYTMYQEMITKIASKSANSINEVMKSQ